MLLGEKILQSKNKFNLFIVTTFIGLGSGLIGMFLVLLLHFIQHLAYGYSPHLVISHESFLEGVIASTPERRVIILTLCGFIAGFGWWTLHRFGKPLVSISQSIKTNKKMPYLSTSIHALLQIITIALGSPLGREVAPREVGALWASWLSLKAGLTLQETKIMLACGAGAGLAAVYNVPLGGSIFVLEVLIGTYSWPIFLLASYSSAIATLVSWWGLGNELIYHIPPLQINSSLILWSALTSPLFGFCAFLFIRIASFQREKVLHSSNMIVFCILNFMCIGLLAIYFPSLLGNGKSPAQIEFAYSLGIGLSAFLLVLRSFIIWSSLRVGAQGGLLTPSLANGALLGAFLGGLWNYFWPTPIESFALVGATAFLAAAQKMPLTAIILIFELTHLNFSFLVPIMFAITGACITAQSCSFYFTKN
ncbi:MAG: chloride channel protein [bacterium]|nr:chloride channel protein [bacterium]